MRAFFAVLPPPQVLADLEEFLESRREAGQHWRWSRTEQLHLTLAFLPDLADWREERLVEAARDWAVRRESVRMSLGGAGAFPDPGRARVLWVGVVEAEADWALRHWSRGLRDLANTVGAMVDGQRFTPHLTVARSGRPQAAGRWVQALDTYRSAPFEVTEIALVASYLGQGPGGRPRYEARATLALPAG